MLIYTKNVNWKKLKSMASKPEAAVPYVLSLIPDWAAHIRNIKNNQRYYASVYMRKVYALPFKDRMAIVNALTENISVSGLTNCFISIEEILDVCDKEALLAALKEYKNAQNFN